MRLYVGLFSISITILLIDVLFYLVFLRKTRFSTRWLIGNGIFSIIYIVYWIWLFLSSPKSYNYLETDNYALFFIATSLFIVLYIPRILSLVFKLLFYGLQWIKVVSSKVLNYLSLGIGGGFFILMLLGIFVIRFQFRVIEQEIQHKSVPVAFNDYRIVQISDLHLGTSKLKKDQYGLMVKQINELNPDLVVFTGDIVNNFATELAGWDTIFNQIKSKEGVYAILGNHDYGDYVAWSSPIEKQQNFNHILSFFKQVDWQLLRNEHKFLVRDNDTLVLAGVENWGHPPFPQYGDLQAALPDSCTNPVVLLSHDPSHWDAEIQYADQDIFLTLAGHTHGFQFGIRSDSFNWSPVHLRYDKWGGLYKKNDRYLYVNVGAGTIGFPGRIGMRPEITLITLKKP